MTVATKAREPESIAVAIRPWIDATFPDPSSVVVEEIRPFGTGASSETFYLRLSVASPETGGSEFVVRTSPLGEGIFPDYDMQEQCRIINGLGSKGALTPAPVAFVAGQHKEDGLMIMPLIEGEVPPSTAAPYSKSGWVVDLPHDRQRHLVESFTDAMAVIHSIDPVEIGLADGVLGKEPGLAGEFAWWVEYFEGVKQDMPAELVEPIEGAVEWCLRTMPADDQPHSVLWGDSRYGNVIFDPEQNVVGVCDWEMAGIGPAEWDLGYHFAHRNNSAWLAGKVEDLDGTPPRAEQIARYESRLGRPVKNLAWHEAAAGTRLAMMHLALRKIFRHTDTTHWNLPPALPEWISAIIADYDADTKDA